MTAGGNTGDGTGNRWQGYSHGELYQLIKSGPGPASAGVVANHWSGLSDALNEIQQDITSGVAASGAGWEGSAADAARFALAPLGDWAEQAALAADTMRVSTDLQGQLLAKARADMPPPVPVTAEQPNPAVTEVAHLFGFQTDHEIQEAAADAAEQRAFEVMADYESYTTDNTDTLGEFSMPPSLEVRSATGSTRSRRGTPRSHGPHSTGK